SITDGLEFQNIVNFESTAGRCDPIVAGSTTMQANCMYFNYDGAQGGDAEPPACHAGMSQTVVHSPPSCSFPPDILQSLQQQQVCTRPDGTTVDFASNCAKSNLTQGTIPTEAIEGGGHCASTRALHLAASNLSICMNEITNYPGWGGSLAINFFVNTNGHP